MMLLLALLLQLLQLSPRAAAFDPDQEDFLSDEEQRARNYLDYVDAEFARRSTAAVRAAWDYASNITDENLARKLEVSAENARYQKQQWQETIKYHWQSFRDADLRRQFKKYAVLGTAALSEEKHDKLEKLISEMESIYSKAKICDYKNSSKCDLSLEPELVEVLRTSRDPGELQHVWLEWRRVSGEKCRASYEHYVALSNEAASLNNFTDNAEYWLTDYEANDFPEQVDRLWKQLEPLYKQLHAYVRRKLREAYGDEVVSARGPIPAHLLGNMWSQTWNNILDITTPYPQVEAVDVTSQMVKQGYKPLKMFQLAEEFFVSLNLSAMPESFWQDSILEKPTDRDIVCHASAWDFYDGKDFRIKQCTQINMQHLFTAHHEMGHVQYFLQYRDQPTVYKEGANPGFHEAVGDVMSLSVSTPRHMRELGLLDADAVDDRAAAVNYLYLQGLQKIAFLPSALLMDVWRWDVFKGRTASDRYNCDWWKLREKYQGIEPPTDRTEDDFDPGAKYHIIASVPYIRYFVSYVIQFQFHRSLCQVAGQFDPDNPEKMPLHECDIYQSKEAGNLLGKMLQMGSSRPWTDAMQVVTGQREMDASGLLQYFSPLLEWLQQENNRTGEYIGWEPTTKVCVSSREELERLRGVETATEG
ncbi:angiotensin-converting enzyme-like [Bacillus rossius redtenbacheri]|uniref:angiotensin-converting enzyme-like n=1 Tax=Bacillus rossius redtenbacheri TaxID=93214 RepID=UPI002FDE8CF5